MPRPNPAVWAVDYEWSLDGQPHLLELVGIPKLGPVGTLAIGRRIAQRMLEAVRYAS